MSEQTTPRDEEAVIRPHRDRPVTGDDAVDAALRTLEGRAEAPLASQLEAAEDAHRALHERLRG